mgnify:CR=1 FL=1
MQIGYANDPRHRLEDEIDWIADNGFDYIDLMVAAPAAALESTPWKDVANQISSRGLGVVCHAPAKDAAWFRTLAPGATLVAQPDAGFGARLDAATRAPFERDARRAVTLGADVPQVGPARLRAALDALEDADVCLGPAEDGGYYLVGLRAPAPGLFEGVEWSTERVLDQTLARAEARGLRAATLPVEVDVDDARDLERISAALRADPSLAPYTAAALDDL